MKPYSLEHSIYLRRLKREKRWVLFFQLFLCILFFSLWEISSQSGVINSFLFSSPSRMIHTITQLLFSGELIKHIQVSLFEIIISFSLSIILGFFISVLLWRFPFFSKIMDPFLTIFNSLPKVALGPLIIIWFGANMKSVIVMSLLISLFVTIINIYTGFQNVNSSLLTLVKSFGGGKWQQFWYVVLPSNFKNILSTLKVNISMNLIGVIMGELLVSKSGLGYLIMYGSQVFNLDLVITSIFLICIISYVLYFSIQKIK